MPRDADVLFSFPLASFLLPFCFITVILNFVSDESSPVPNAISTDKHISEHLLEIIERRLRSSEDLQTHH